MGRQTFGYFISVYKLSAIKNFRKNTIRGRGFPCAIASRYKYSVMFSMSFYASDSFLLAKLLKL